MPSLIEFNGESNYDRRFRGNVEFQGEYVARRKPRWLVAGKLAVVLFVIGFAYILALRHIDFPPLQLTAIYFGAVLLYCGIAYVVRPNPNDMNMGWGGGLMNDPIQYSDNINRGLRNLECLLQPGQLATEAVLDLLNLCGWHEALHLEDSESQESAPPEHRYPEPRDEQPYELPPAASPTTGRVLPPDRFDRT